MNRSIGSDFCKTGWMRYIKVTADGSGGSRFEDAEIIQAETPYTANTPPVLVSSAIPATGFAFVTLSPDVRETGWHPPPRRQFVVILDGEFELETTDPEEALPARRGAAHGRPRGTRTCDSGPHRPARVIRGYSAGLRLSTGAPKRHDEPGISLAQHQR